MLRNLTFAMLLFVGLASRGQSLTWGTGNKYYRITTPYGKVDIGAQNSSGLHIYTDRDQFYFNKEVTLITGVLAAYQSNPMVFKTGGAQRLTIDGSGNIGINQPWATEKLMVNGNISGKSLNQGYSYLYRFGGLFFTWDSDSYGTNPQHSIRSTYGDTPGDEITLNSYNHIRLNLDANSNDNTSYFEVGQHTTGTNNILFRLESPTGNVGIGATSPQAKLDVRGGLVLERGGNAFLYTGTGSSENNRYLQLLNSPSTGSGSGLMASGVLVADNHSYAAPSKNDLIVKGTVGIGSSNPSKLLHVRGNPEDDNDSDILAIFENSASSSEDAGIAIKGSRNASTGTVSFIDLDIYDSNETTTNFTMGRIGAGKSNGAGINGQLRFFTNNNGSLGERMRIKQDGKVGIGTTSPTKMLEVAGTAYAREVKVDISAGADFVFADDYDLPSLEETSRYVQENHHLPGIASAAEMESEGIELGEMNIRLLQKIEELTLHLIEQQKRIDQLEKQMAEK